MKNIFSKIKKFWSRRPLSQKLFCKITLLLAFVFSLILIFFPEYSKIIQVIFLSIISNSLIPVPHEPIILCYSKIIHPFPLAFYGALGASIAAVIDFYIVKKAFSHHKIAPLKETKFFKIGVKYFKKVPFITILLFSTGIIPIFTPIRILTPVSGYSIVKYTFGIFLGRAGRFLLLASFSYVLKLPTWSIVAIGIITSLFTIWIPLENFIKIKFKNKTKGEQHETQREDASASL